MDRVKRKNITLWISRRSTTFSESFQATRFLAPLFLFVALFILLPVMGSFVDSLFLDVTFRQRKFVFFENFEQLFRDPAFWGAFRFTCLFALVSVPVETFLGLMIALVINERFPGRDLLRACVLIPWAIPATVSGRIFELIYNYSFGAANYLLEALLITEEPVNWLGTEMEAFFALVAADAWKTTPFCAIILLSGLSAIPEDLYQQARIDRANFAQRFFRLTLPLLKPVVIVVLIFRTIEALRIFDLVFVLTGGGPGGATNSLSLYAFGYFSAGDFGYASACSVVLFIVAFAFSWIFLKVGRFQREAI